MSGLNINISDLFGSAGTLSAAVQLLGGVVDLGEQLAKDWTTSGNAPSAADKELFKQRLVQAISARQAAEGQLLNDLPDDPNLPQA